MHSRWFYGAWMGEYAFTTIARCVIADVAPLIRDSRPKHIRRDSFARFFFFAHGPPITRQPVPSHARRNLQVLGTIYQA
jgi:hypothetical protein